MQVIYLMLLWTMAVFLGNVNGFFQTGLLKYRDTSPPQPFPNPAPTPSATPPQPFHNPSPTALPTPPSNPPDTKIQQRRLENPVNVLQSTIRAQRLKKINLA